MALFSPRLAIKYMWKNSLFQSHRCIWIESYLLAAITEYYYIFILLYKHTEIYIQVLLEMVNQSSVTYYWNLRNKIRSEWHSRSVAPSCDFKPFLSNNTLEGVEVSCIFTQENETPLVTAFFHYFFYFLHFSTHFQLGLMIWTG